MAIKTLPELCYSTSSLTGKTIVIKKGESGYYPCKDGYEDIPATELNEKLGVTKGQRLAMEMGSMFGWHTKGADPNTYNDDGTPRRDA